MVGINYLEDSVSAGKRPVPGRRDFSTPLRCARNAEGVAPLFFPSSCAKSQDLGGDGATFGRFCDCAQNDGVRPLRSARSGEGAAVGSRTEGARRWLKGARRQPGKHSATDGKRPAPDSAIPLRSAQNDGVRPLRSARSGEGAAVGSRTEGARRWLKGARRQLGKHSATDGKRPAPDSATPLRSAQNDGVRPLRSARSGEAGLGGGFGEVR